MYRQIRELRLLIKRHRYRSQIERRIADVYGRGSTQYQVLLTTLDQVVKTHDNGRRRNGELLKSHEFSMFAIAFVYCNIRDVLILLSILLHDMMEDYPAVWSYERIRQMYGEEVAKIVFALTKPDAHHFSDQNTYEQAVFARVREGGEKALTVKCIDRLHNMLTLYGDAEKQHAKVLQTVKYVLPMTVERQFLTYELTLATAEQMSLLRMKQREGGSG
ncbi:MAG: hypothetical protein RL097_81 [Candidatus Parcubacteria bacterium]